MAQENITVELPGCGGEAVIRSYIKNKDRKAISRMVFAGKEFKQSELVEASKKGEDIELTIPGVNLGSVTNEQTRRLLISYDGNTKEPYEEMMESEYKEDMDVVENVVRAVFRDHSEDSVAKK